MTGAPSGAGSQASPQAPAGLGQPVSIPSAAPHRVQLSRKKGWRMPENTVVVSRPSKWGNPEDYHVLGRDLAVRLFAKRLAPGGFGLGPIQATLTAEDVRRELAGKNLACWCPLDQPCHADVLLELANASGMSAEGRDGEAGSGPQDRQPGPQGDAQTSPALTQKDQ